MNFENPSLTIFKYLNIIFYHRIVQLIRVIGSFANVKHTVHFLKRCLFNKRQFKIH